MNPYSGPIYPHEGMISHWTQVSGATNTEHSHNPTTSPAAFFHLYEEGCVLMKTPPFTDAVVSYGSNAEQRSHKPTDCCDFPALQPFFSQYPGCLQTVNSTAANAVGALHQFCASCVKAAQKVAEMNPGLKIRDDASGIVYQSPLTGRAFASQDMSMQTANLPVSFPIPASVRQTTPCVIQGAQVPPSIANGNYDSSTGRFEYRRRGKTTYVY
ncbi:hypothetical protein DFH09DRAFT_1085127 [Mycena vulgaris]|nr:hypothetical protein DFH09DRAFT_1085127 [Mycena vulgaris]